MNPSLNEAVAYCGLFCADCPGHTGAIADLARDLRKELRRTRFDLTADYLASIKVFKEYKNYKTCYEVLGTMVKFRCGRLCREGGGNPFCKIRKCCQRKELTGCWDCDDLDACQTLDFLEPNHGDAHLKNLRKIKKKGMQEFLAGKKLWYSPSQQKK